MDVYESNEHDGDFDSRPREHVGDKLGEFCVAVDIFRIRCAAGRGGPTDCKVYGFDRALYEIV